MAKNSKKLPSGWQYLTDAQKQEFLAKGTKAKPKVVAEQRSPISGMTEAEMRKVGGKFKPESKLRQAVNARELTVKEAAEQAKRDRFYTKNKAPTSAKAWESKKSLLNMKAQASAPKPQKLKLGPDFKPDVPKTPEQVYERSLAKSKNTVAFSGVDPKQSFDDFVKNLQETKTANEKAASRPTKTTIKVKTSSGSERTLQYRYGSNQIKDKLQFGKISPQRANDWALAKTNRVQRLAKALEKQDVLEAKEFRKQQRANGVQIKQKAEARRQLFQEPVTKRFKAEKAISNRTLTIYAADKKGSIKLPEYGKQGFVRVSPEQFDLAREAEVLSAKDKAVTEGKSSFGKALENINAGKEVEMRRKMTPKELESAFENTQKEASLLENRDMPKNKKPVASKKKMPRIKGEKAQLLPAGSTKKAAEANANVKKGKKPVIKQNMELNAENLKKVMNEPSPAENVAESKKAPKRGFKWPDSAPKPKAEKPTAPAKDENMKPKKRAVIKTEAPTAPAPEKAPASKVMGKKKPVIKAEAPASAPVTEKAPASTGKKKPVVKAQAPVAKADTPKATTKKPVVKAPAVATETPKVTPAPKQKAAPKAKATPKVAPASTGPSKEQLAKQGDARAAGVRERANNFRQNQAIRGAEQRMAGRASSSKQGWVAKNLPNVSTVLKDGLASSTGRKAAFEAGKNFGKGLLTKGSVAFTALTYSPDAGNKAADDAVGARLQAAVRQGRRDAAAKVPAKASSPAPKASAQSTPKASAKPVTKKAVASAPAKKSAPASSPAPKKAVEIAKANPDRAIADFEAKLRGAGVVSIAGGASGKAQAIPQAMSVTQLEDQFKRKKGPK